MPIEKQQDIIKIAKQYGISPGIASEIKVDFDDTKEDIIKNLFKTQTEHFAQKSIEIQKNYDELSELETKNSDLPINKEDYEKQFNAFATKLVALISQQNKDELARYIIRRGIIVKLLMSALNKGLTLKEELKDKGVPNNLWILNEEFVHFYGVSEQSISDIKINGSKIIRDLSEEEKEQLNEFNEKRLKKRIDLLFFPEERKCIIIELKDPKVGVNENAGQMDKYAQLLANFVKPEFAIEHFYTYLITDNFNKYDKPTGYRRICNIEGFVRDSVDIKSFENDITIANQYSEIIRYTDMYERAIKRNEIFFNKLTE